MNQNMYLLGPHGEIRFTREGVERLQPLFNLAGINIKEIKTIGDYLRAREQASPYFIRHLEARASKWPETEQYKLLRVAIFGNEAELQDEVYRYDMKKNLRLVR